MALTARRGILFIKLYPDPVRWVTFLLKVSYINGELISQAVSASVFTGYLVSIVRGLEWPE